MGPALHRPSQKYCDITGLLAAYRDPHTLLYYASALSAPKDFSDDSSWPRFGSPSEVRDAGSHHDDALGLFEFIRGLTPQRVQAYLQLRSAGTTLI